MTYDVSQIRAELMEAAVGQRPTEDWLRDIEGTSVIDGEPGTFGLTVGGQDFFVTIEPA